MRICAQSVLLFLGWVLTALTLETFDIAILGINSTETKTPFDFNITFRTVREIFHEERVIVKLPRFTRLLTERNVTYQNITYDDLRISPSYFYQAEWIEGTQDNINFDTPFASSELRIQTKGNRSIAARELLTITVHKENGIGAYCGFPSSKVYNASRNLIHPFPKFEIMTEDPSTARYNRTAAYQNITYSDSLTLLHNITAYHNITFYLNATGYSNDSYVFDEYAGVGQGCDNLNHCFNYGACDYCFEKCHCFDGHGSDDDVITTGRDIKPDCSSWVCPAGKAIGDVATASNKAHAHAECSNMGICDRSTGTCKCFKPYTGAACEKLSCPNDCSGHGRCVSIAEMARVRYLNNPNRYASIVYGSGSGLDTTAWDHGTMYGCLCDSSWPVGYDEGQRQIAEYFGPDCSQRHCPSGDDPFTSVDEQDCLAKTQQLGNDVELGKWGNLCQVDCSNRGKCDFKTGVCTCFEGSWGLACENVANAGRHEHYGPAMVPTFAMADVNDSIIVEGN